LAIADWIGDCRLDWRLPIGLAIADWIGDCRLDWRLPIGLAIAIGLATADWCRLPSGVLTRGAASPVVNRRSVNPHSSIGNP
jgi:hypothetical protein